MAHVGDEGRAALDGLLRAGREGPAEAEVTLRRADGTTVPLYLGVSPMHEGPVGLCLIVTDMTQQVTRRKAEQYPARVARLQAMTATLSEAVTVRQVARAIVRHGLTALGGQRAVLAVLTSEGSALELVHTDGFPAEFVERFRRFPTDAPAPMAEAILTGQPVLLRTAEEYRARFPELTREIDKLGLTAGWCTVADAGNCVPGRQESVPQALTGS